MISQEWNFIGMFRIHAIKLLTPEEETWLFRIVWIFNYQASR
jgi:hypothetical protein